MKWYQKLNPFRTISRRRFTAAQMSRLVADWVNSNVKTNDDIKRHLPVLVARSRDLAKNNSEYRKFLAMKERNVVGDTGIKLQVRAKNPDGALDKYANSTIEHHFMRWGRKRNGWCYKGRKLSWHAIQILFIRTLAIDGEVFIRKIFGDKKNPYKFSLQFLNSTLCDINYNEKLSNGNRVVMGVELNHNEAPVAYWFKTDESDIYAKRVRIPENEIIHHFKQEFIGQVRGFPQACAAILDINMLGGYKEAELIAARVTSAKMGFLIPEKGRGGRYNPDGDDGKMPINEVSPGALELLPAGYKFEKFDPQNPGANFAGFFKAIMRSIASGLGIAYNDFANDLEGVNFSSMRAGNISERDGWKLDQLDMIESFCEDVYLSWLTMFLLSGLTNLPFTKLEKYESDSWQGRRWPFVDPLKDAKFAATMISQKLKSPQSFIMEIGGDPDEVIEDFKEWEEKLEKAKLIKIEGEKPPKTETTK